MRTMISSLFIFTILLSISFQGCLGKPDVSGKWVSEYVEMDKDLGKINMRFTMNINKNFKYSITTKGTIEKHDLSKVFSRQSGVWIMEDDMIVFTPIVCNEADANLFLEEIECDSISQPIKVLIIDNSWNFARHDGEELKLIRR